MKIIKSEKKTAILVTHDINEAISMSDKIFVLTSRPGSIKSVHKLNFDEKPILFGEVRTEKGIEYNGKYNNDLKAYKKGDRTISDIKERI